LEYAALRARDLSLRCLQRLISTLSRHVTSAGEMLRDIRRDLSFLASEFSPPPPISGEWQGVLESLQRKVAESLQGRMEELAIELARTFLPRHFGENGGLRQLVSLPEQRATLPTALRRAARVAVQEALRCVDVTAALYEPAVEGESTVLRDCLAAAQPVWLSQCGGARRTLLFLPTLADSERLSSALADQGYLPSLVVSADDGEVVFCSEAQDIPPARVALALAQQRAGLGEIAARVRTRLDITWKPLGAER
jgi:hypothetical protein